ncbi:hypothetical protein SAMN04488125_1413 [Methylorubrum salsuginis]|uniref:Uncharacterized protein n=2 Tax=Methylorubrum salsuginis TaxID=414703 RepID=A0A1I4MNG5_9HYPH|nr:hypothetical protein SAMN04488125_1413 [Methylorubrum salsuginis]
MQVDVAVSSVPDIGSAVANLRWIGILRVVGAALVALGVGLELVGEVLGHPSEQTLRSAREAEIASLTMQVEELRRVAGDGLSAQRNYAGADRPTVSAPAQEPGRSDRRPVALALEPEGSGDRAGALSDDVESGSVNDSTP